MNLYILCINMYHAKFYSLVMMRYQYTFAIRSIGGAITMEGELSNFTYLYEQITLAEV